MCVVEPGWAQLGSLSCSTTLSFSPGVTGLAWTHSSPGNGRTTRRQAGTCTASWDPGSEPVHGPSCLILFIQASHKIKPRNCKVPGEELEYMERGRTGANIVHYNSASFPKVEPLSVGWASWLPSNEQSNLEVTVCPFQGQDTGTPSLPFGGSSLWGSQPPYCEDTQAALWRDPHGKDLETPASSCGSESSWKQVLRPQSSLQTTTAYWHPDGNFLRDPELEPSG